MPPLRRATADETIRVLERVGFVRDRQRGSHVVLERTTDQGTQTCIVPVRRGPLAIGTLRGIIRQAGLTVEEFLSHL
jgi:predicted RNA binding protein YcfA (HicA-like mRNA interferase family)